MRILRAILFFTALTLISMGYMSLAFGSEYGVALTYSKVDKSQINKDGSVTYYYAIGAIPNAVSKTFVLDIPHKTYLLKSVAMSGAVSGWDVALCDSTPATMAEVMYTDTITGTSCKFFSEAIPATGRVTGLNPAESFSNRQDVIKTRCEVKANGGALTATTELGITVIPR